MKLAVLILSMLLFSSNSYAEKITSVRCGNKFIELGMNRTELIEACGKKWVPDEIRTKIKWYKSQGAIKHFVAELPASANTYQFWIYRDYGKFETWVWITNGRVVRLEETSERVGK